MAKLLFDLFAWTMNGFNGWLASPAMENVGEFILAVLCFPSGLMLLLIFFGLFRGEPAEQPDPYNGMHPADVASHKRSGTLSDAHVIHTAARLNQQGSGRERGPIKQVMYVPGADYETWRYAKWIKDNHPTKISNPHDVPASDAERLRQQDIASGRQSAHYNSDTGKWELD